MGVERMTARDLLDYLADADYSITTDGRMLHIRGPAPLDEELKASLARHKKELIVELLALQVAGEQATAAVEELLAAGPRAARNGGGESDHR